MHDPTCDVSCISTNIQDGGQLNISSQIMSRNKADIKIGTLSVHVGILSEVRKDTPNYNC